MIQPEKPFSFGDSAPRHRLVALVLAALTLTIPAASHANQVFKACGKKWIKKARTLQPEQLAWMLTEGSASMTADFDGDGAADNLIVTSTTSYRNCDVANMWDKKETTVLIEYSDGKAKIFHWISNGLVKRLKFFSGLSRFLVVAVDARGRELGRWVETGRAGPPPTLIAGGGSPAEAAATFELASIR